MDLFFLLLSLNWTATVNLQMPSFLFIHETKEINSLSNYLWHNLGYLQISYFKLEIIMAIVTINCSVSLIDEKRQRGNVLVEIK